MMDLNKISELLDRINVVLNGYYVNVEIDILGGNNVDIELNIYKVLENKVMTLGYFRTLEKLENHCETLINFCDFLNIMQNN